MPRTRTFPPLSLATLALLCAGSAGAQAPRRSLDALLAPIVRETGVPAIGAAIVTADGAIALGTSGVRQAGRATPVDLSDRWHLGSCTKTITATLVARLVDRGVVRWETTVGEVWGARLANMSPAWRDVTLLQLLAHRSGAPGNPDDATWERVVRSARSLVAQRRELTDSLFSRPPIAPPDSVTEYSNAAFIAVGAMLERVTGASWENLVQREIFAPLGMRSAGFGVAGAAGVLRQARGHVAAGDRFAPVPWGPGADNPRVTGPAGSVHATLGDWGRFVAAHLRGARGDTTFLSRAQWARILTASDDRADYTAGWKRLRDASPSTVTLTHLGSNGFWIAQASVAPAPGYAILLTSNVASDRLEAPFERLVRVLGDSARVMMRR